MSSLATRKQLILGTAGHIDHGKTRLVGRLTNIDTDRLPEEKARGISIDLGFAHWETDGIQFGVVDVPGHERFVKNMVAGATGINLALLVVAADDGFMPQTREHLEILDLLGVEHGVVAITKIDLIDDDELLQLAQMEVEEQMQRYHRAWPILLVSSETGAGIDELKSTIEQMAAQIEPPATHDWFRMPIDRLFSITGHGTVVTGSVLSGEVHAGDVLELLPDQKEVRVRTVEHHGELIEQGGERQRTAINIAGVKTEELSRGQELATPGILKPSTRLLVQLKTEPDARWVIKNRDEFHLHLGTAEIPCRVILKEGELTANSLTFAELRTRQPMVAAYGQRFILRKISPADTVAGGMVLDPGIPIQKRLKNLTDLGEVLAETDLSTRLGWLFSTLDEIPESPHLAAWRVGIHGGEYRRLLEEMKAGNQVINVGEDHHPHWTHLQRLEQLAKSMMRMIRETLALHQPRCALPKKLLLNSCRDLAARKLLEVVFGNLMRTGELVRVGSNFGPADAQVQLSRKQQQVRNQLLEIITEAELLPPTVKELAEQLSQPTEQLEQLLTVCVEDDLLRKISDALYFSPAALERARQLAAELFTRQPAATMSELRECWGITRKFAVPLCEYFDKLEITRRNKNDRHPGANLHHSINLIDQE